MKEIVDFIKKEFKTDQFIPLHEPRFVGNEKQYLNDCIDSTFVSSVGAYVDRFEKDFAKYVGSKYAIATVNGTSALHIALLLANVTSEDEVITQPLTFIATANAIGYTGAEPVFVDVSRETLGMCPQSLLDFLEDHCEIVNGLCINKTTKKIIKACVPMHTFGHPCEIEKIANICDTWNIALVEDSAESLGSYFKEKHTGTFGLVGIFSFNGNKVITSGGGGVIVTDNEVLAKKAKHLTTTAKVPHKWEYSHDFIGYNYRLPNLNAALLVAQMENLDSFLENKRDLAQEYKRYFQNSDIVYIDEPKDCKSNFWLNAIVLKNLEERNKFLEYSNSNGVMTRPIWTLMNKLDMFKSCQSSDLNNAQWLEERVVNIPSSVRI